MSTYIHAFAQRGWKAKETKIKKKEGTNQTGEIREMFPSH